MTLLTSVYVLMEKTFIFMRNAHSLALEGFIISILSSFNKRMSCFRCFCFSSQLFSVFPVWYRAGKMSCAVETVLNTSSFFFSVLDDQEEKRCEVLPSSLIIRQSNTDSII